MPAVSDVRGLACAELTCRPSEPSAQAWKSRTALTALPNKPSPSIDEPKHQGDDLDASLCYACLTTMASGTARGPAVGVGKVPELPLWVRDRPKRRVLTPAEMRKDVEDFLL